jgi:hypothetical protein
MKEEEKRREGSNNTEGKWEVEDGSELGFEREMFNSCFKQHKNLHDFFSGLVGMFIE